AVGRQPAEGGDRPLAAAPAARPDPRRADPRRRHRRARRDPPAGARPGRRGHGGAGRLLRTRRTARSLRPRAGDGRGTDRPRTRGRRHLARRDRRIELRRNRDAPRQEHPMTAAAVAGGRRLSPRARTTLGLFARWGTIIGLVAMIAAFSVLSPRAFPTV